jgi:hypothetical protein
MTSSPRSLTGALIEQLVQGYFKLVTEMVIQILAPFRMCMALTKFRSFQCRPRLFTANMSTDLEKQKLVALKNAISLKAPFCSSVCSLPVSTFSLFFKRDKTVR